MPIWKALALVVAGAAVGAGALAVLFVHAFLGVGG
jgi:hypothetical protein